MGTQRVQMKEVLPWMVRCACRADTRDFCSGLAVLVGPVQNIFSFPNAHERLKKRKTSFINVS
jgi:hypothetical protein